MRELTLPERWIDTARECSCTPWDCWPDPSCEKHGMDAYYGRYESYWWGRIRLPHAGKPSVVAVATRSLPIPGAGASGGTPEAQERQE